MLVLLVTHIDICGHYISVELVVVKNVGAAGNGHLQLWCRVHLCRIGQLIFLSDLLSVRPVSFVSTFMQVT